jgi:hypothetical protein
MIGIGLAGPTSMKFLCRHCDQITIGQPFRVISEEDGVILLNMTVCRSCGEQAKTLGLRSEPISLDLNPGKEPLPLIGASVVGARRESAIRHGAEATRRG